MSSRTILLVGVITTFAIPCSAADYDITRLEPAESSLMVLTDKMVNFKTLFSLHWGYGWNYAQWYVDDQAALKDDALGAHDGITLFGRKWSAPGSHTVKVRANYDSIPFGVDVWTSYLSWTITVVSPDTYTVERIQPPEHYTEIVHNLVGCGAKFGGLVSQATWQWVEWYVDGVLDGAGPLTEGLWGYVSYIHPTFTIGTHEVKVRAKWSLSGAEVWTSYTTWTIEIVPHPPTASCVAPSSPVSTVQGRTQAFTARGTDVGEIEHRLEIAGVRWYIDGVLQSTVETGTIWASTVDNTWSHTFDTEGTYLVEAVFYDYEGYSSTSGQAVWTVVVERPVHAPSASIMSPGSPVTVYTGRSVTFEVTGTDAGNDLSLCEVSLDGVPQTNASFSGTASGSTAEWTHTFDTPGTYEVAFVPVDLAGDHGSAGTWTVKAESHDPTGTIVSPTGSVTVFTGAPVTFTLTGTDPAGDLASCEVYLGGAFQGLVPFSDRASGSTAAWTHTFSTPGTYQVELRPRDWADNSGTAQVWTVTAKPDPGQAGLNVLVIELDAQGRAQGPLADAKVDLTGPSAATEATTDGQGKFTFAGLDPGTYGANVSKDGYYAQSRSVSLAAGETKDEVFRLTPESSEPSAFDLTSPRGKHFIEGLPGNLSFSVVVAWNGSPGQVHFTVAGTRHAAQITDLGKGTAQASLIIPAPNGVASCSELTMEVTNGEGKTTFMTMGVYFYPLPDIISAWYGGVLSWLPEGKTLTFTRPTKSYPFWDFESGAFSANAAAGWQGELSVDPWAGTLSGSLGGTGEFGVELDVAEVELLGEGSVSLDGAVEVALAGCSGVKITPSWTLSASGKAGIGAPAVLVINAVFPPAAPAVNSVLKVPIVGDLLKALRLRLYLILGGELTGEYEGLASGDCFLGTTSLSGSVTVGLEAQAVVKIKRWFIDAEAGVYAGGTGTPEFTFCPEFAIQALTVRAYVGVYASSRGYRLSKEVGLNIPLISSDGDRKITISSVLAESYAGGAWEPIGDSALRWGEMNLLAGEGSSGGRLHALSVRGESSQETRLVENVVPLASPATVSRSSERLILFCLQDPNKPWWASTDIGTVRQADDQPWVLDRIADDQAAEFSPSIAAADSSTALAAWERVSGDTSDANDPSQVAPHLEIVAAWFDSNTGIWSVPEQLTSNAVADHPPMPIAFGATRGILWIASEEDPAMAGVSAGDRLMFVKWSGGGWDQPQTLWSAPKGILSFAFIADDFGAGHVAFAVDEDADPNTAADCELYLLSTANGAWQTAIQLTSDFVEDAMPTLVAPYGVPMCVWSADGTLVYSHLYDWNPRQVYSEYTLANEAPSLDAVTMPGGAAIAYTVQGPNGVDIVASFYDADLDCWSLPRQLTNDEHAETALSLTCDADELVIAYLKTQTLRTGMDVEIDGQMQHLENVPQPGRTDLYVLRHALADDLAVVPESLVLDPVNPAPGTVATIRGTVENRGDLPLQDVVAVFYDGDPSSGGVPVADNQVIPGTLIAGGKQDVSVSWNVPPSQSSHEIFIVVDPCLAVEDRDRSNNVLSACTVLPDLAIATCWSTEVSPSSMALTARVINTGVIPAGAFDVSWRLGASDGEQIGTSTIPSLVSGGAFEATFIWDTTGHLDGGSHAQVFAVADSAEAVPEFDETNNVSSLVVFHPPAPEP